MNGLILAAGKGSRLMPMTNEIPKALVKLKGKPLIFWTLDHMIDCGIKRIGIVVGYKAEILIENQTQRKAREGGIIMAMYDWNHNGKNDPVDDYLEYQIYHNCKSDNDRPHHTQSSGGISTFGAVFSMICGMVLQAFIYTVFGIDVKDVPVVILLILWVFLSALAAVVVEKIGL